MAETGNIWARMISTSSALSARIWKRLKLYAASSPTLSEMAVVASETTMLFRK